jgi:agmatinase
MNNIEFDPNGIVPDNGNYFGMPCSPEEAALVLISAPWDITVSMRAGSSYAPDAIIEASRNIDLHEPMSPGAWRKGIATLPIDYSIQDLSHRLRSDAERVVKAGEEFGVSILNNIMHERRLRRVNEGSEAVNATIYNEAIKWFAKNKIVGLVGGDQSTAYGVIRAAGEHYSEIGVLHIDSHCDLRDSHHGFTHSHSSIMHNVLRDVEGVDRLVSVGVREFSHAEWERAEQDERIRLFTGQYIWTAHFEGVNWSTIAQEIIESLPEKVYISLDIDGLTIECSPHTGTTISGGLRFPEVVYLMSKIVDSGRQIVGFDLTEVVPDVDDKSDAMIAARLLFKMCSVALKHVECDDVL